MSRPPAIPGLAYVRPLGSGGFADVYLYQQQLPQRTVAVKVLKAQGLTDAIRAQFTAEANAMAGLADHPNIVPVFAADVAGDGRPYLVMMYYPRPNLAVRAASERLGVAEVLRLGVQVSSAVATAHAAGILHRDIKPSNILTSQYGAPGLTDFGIAAQAALVDEDDDAGVSVPWSPPEVLYGSAPASVRSDVYSLAATLWNLLVGRSPFEIMGGDNSAYALMARIRDVPPPATGRADVPESLDRLLQQALAKDPAARPVSVIEFARSLQAIESSLHLPRTEVVVLVEKTETSDGAAGAAVAVPIAEPTRMRAAQRVNAQPPPSENVQSNKPAEPRTAARPAAQQAPPIPATPAGNDSTPSGAEPTVRRPISVAGDSRDSASDRKIAEPVDDTKPLRRHRTMVYVAAGIACAATVVGVLAAVGVFSGASGKPPSPIATVTSSGPQDPGQLGAALPPGTPRVRAHQQGAKSVQFEWTYSAYLNTDTYVWKLSDGSKHGTVNHPWLTLQDPQHRRMCLQVKVIRADGSNGSATYSPEGCGT